MKLTEITDQIIRAIDGTVRTDDSKMSERAIEALVPKWKQMAHLIIYNGSKNSKANKFIGAENYMRDTLTYDASVQVAGAEFVRFQGEAAVQLNDYHNGCRFIGDSKTGQNFILLRSPSDYGVYKDAGLISLNEVYYCNTGPYWDTYGNLQLKSIDRDFIPADPLGVASFNPDTMEYPVSKDVLDLILKLAVSELAPEAAKPADLLNNESSNG